MTQAAHSTEVEPAREDLRPPTEREFRLFQKLVYEHAGIFLAPTKRALLNGRLARRVRELGLRTFAAYYEYLDAHRESETAELFDRITTNETAFFREPRHFDVLRQRVLPALLAENSRARTLRCWSAGCSTGEEPHSLAMTALEAIPDGWRLEIVASDISARALRKAVAGVWPIERSNAIPKPLLKKYMLRGIGPNEGTFKAAPALTQTIRFIHLNLNESDFGPLGGAFDVIFCRNVLIYFDHESKKRAVERLIDRLSPSGYLFVGHAESLAGMTDQLHCVEPTVYAKS
jgi:chemotaxis protein methyltransferase CheR